MKCPHYIGSALLLCPLLFCQPGLTQRGADQVRIAHAQDFPPLAEVKDGKSEGLPSRFFAPLPHGQVCR